MRIPRTFAKNCLGTLGIFLLLASGAIMPHAVVHVQNAATGREIEVGSNGSGIYNATELAVGSYTILVRFPGFKTVIAEKLLLDAGTASILN